MEFWEGKFQIFLSCASYQINPEKNIFSFAHCKPCVCKFKIPTSNNKFKYPSFKYSLRFLAGTYSLSINFITSLNLCHNLSETLQNTPFGLRTPPHHSLWFYQIPQDFTVSVHDQCIFQKTFNHTQHHFLRDDSFHMNRISPG